MVCLPGWRCWRAASLCIGRFLAVAGVARVANRLARAPISLVMVQ
jgi:hypothetical protein